MTDNPLPWIGVDLDGTLAHYDEWRGIKHIGAPIEPMVARVKEWIKKGRKVKIFTARVALQPGRDLDMVHSVIADWTSRHIGCVLEVTCQKDFMMVELWDDRAVQVEMNTGRVIA